MNFKILYTLGDSPVSLKANICLSSKSFFYESIRQDKIWVHSQRPRRGSYLWWRQSMGRGALWRIITREAHWTEEGNDTSANRWCDSIHLQTVSETLNTRATGVVKFTWFLRILKMLASWVKRWKKKGCAELCIFLDIDFCMLAKTLEFFSRKWPPPCPSFVRPRHSWLQSQVHGFRWNYPSR